MTPPYREPAGAIAFWSIFGVFVLGEYTSRVRSRRSGGRPAERWSLVVVVVCLVVGMIAGFRLATWSPGAVRAGRWPLFLSGLVLMAAGVAVRQWAILTLGRFFTVDVRLHAGQEVVDRGPYRWVRHPSYTGLIAVYAGGGLALTNCAALGVLVLLPTAGLVVRIRSEERALLAGLGDAYARYAAGRRRLLPGVW